jgi:predicted small metal-binding protein
MEMVRLNIVYDLLQKTKLSANIKVNDKILQRTNQVYFVVCNSCYWCASYFGIDDLESLSTSSSPVHNCRICNSRTELIPISTDESFILRCADVGLDCNCVIFGSSEENIVDKTIRHMFEYHAINPEEITSCMKIKIKESVHTSFLASDIYEFSPIYSSTT